MPWRRGWPPFVSQRVIDDRDRATADLEQASDDLKDSAQRALRTHAVADRLAVAGRSNHFSESMEALFATRAERPPRQPRGTE